MVKWRKFEPKKVVKATQDESVKRMQSATILVRDAVKKRLNVGNSTGQEPSEEGESPRKVTARLFNSITTEVVVENLDVVGRIGTNVEYGRRLELGFVGTDALGRNVHQGPRPYLRPGLAENADLVRGILGAKK